MMFSDNQSHITWKGILNTTETEIKQRDEMLETWQ